MKTTMDRSIGYLENIRRDKRKRRIQIARIIGALVGLGIIIYIII